MRQRTLQVKHVAYGRYGGRGIGVYWPWALCYQCFAYAMGLRPDGLTIDRIDVERHYEPGNVRWATRVTQESNKRFVLDSLRWEHETGGWADEVEAPLRDPGRPWRAFVARLAMDGHPTAQALVEHLAQPRGMRRTRVRDLYS